MNEANLLMKAEVIEPGSQPGVSVVIPAFNEQDGIEHVLQQVYDVMCAAGRPFEIIVVDDGSHDRTAEMVRGFGKVTLTQHKVNRGYGASLKTGIRKARYPIIAITDADGTYPNERIPEMVSLLIAGEYEMVVGARDMRGDAIPLARRPAKWVIGRLSELVAEQRIPDINSGLRVFWRSLSMRFFNILSNGFSFTTTITLGMMVNGYQVHYMPIDYYVRKGKSKIRPIRDTARFVQLVFQIALYFSPLKIFLPISGLLIIVGLLWMESTYRLTGRITDASTMAIMMTAVQVAVMGLLADLINRRLGGYQKNEDTDNQWKSQ